MDMKQYMELDDHYGAHNYASIPVVLSKGKGIYVWDVDGKRYFDMMSAYSAVSHGHCHPRLAKALAEQSQKLAVVSRAYYSDTLGAFLKRACELTGFDKALPMNSGAEGVETAIKAARKWAYTKKGVEENKAEIIICDGNFHGRTITIVSMSSEEQYKNGFGPLTPGFKRIPFADSKALENAITPNTAAFLVEPIQGEGGINIPPPNYLKECEEICKKNNVLMIVDEIQTGLGRTGKFLAIEHEGIKPDGLILGKALGGGLLALSMFLSNKEVMDVFTPGDHGSTFGGNPLAAAVGLEALNVLVEEKLAENSARLGEHLLSELKKLKHPFITDVRGRGLYAGIEVDTSKVNTREIILKLADAGLLSKETHERVIRIAPPLVITREELDEALGILKSVFDQF